MNVRSSIALGPDDLRGPETKQQFVCRILRREIQDGLLGPGQPLSIPEVAGRFGVSSIPVREALRQLAQEGLVRLEPHATAVVRGVSVDEALWTADLRTVLEPIAAREAVGRIPDATLDALDGRVATMERAMEAGDLERYLEVNRRFHESIYDHCQNRLLRGMLVELWDVGNRFRRVYHSNDHIRDSQAEHYEIMAALRSEEADRVESIVRVHRQRNSEHLRAFLRQSASAPAHESIEAGIERVP